MDNIRYWLSAELIGWGIRILPEGPIKERFKYLIYQMTQEVLDD